MVALNQVTLPAASGVRSCTSSRLAEVTPVPKTESGHVLTQGNIYVATALTLLPIPAGLAGGAGGVGLAIFLTGANGILAAGCAVAGLAWAVLCVVWLLRHQQFLPSRYLRSVARRSFARRTNPLVRFEDADAEFVDIVPRSNWGRTMLEPATDIGLFAIDHDKQELRFEGDRKRYRIPFDAVTACEVEPIRLNSDEWGNDLYFATVLTVETPTGVREIPLCGRHLEFGGRRMRQRETQANEFCARILLAIAQ